MDEWDGFYRERGHEWGDAAGVLVAFVAGAAATLPSSSAPPGVLDVGCGYGKDTPYLAVAAGGPVLGIDPSAIAVELARLAHPEFRFEVADIADALTLGPFEIVHAANVYHLLREEARASFLVSARGALSPGGLLVLNALSVDDPEEYGSGEPIDSEPGSFVRHGRYGHFFARSELERETSDADLKLERLEEADYEEPHASGVTHHHRSWVLVAAKPE